MKWTVIGRNVRIILTLKSSTMFKSEIFDTQKSLPFLKSKNRCGTRTFSAFLGFDYGKECSHIE